MLPCFRSRCGAVFVFALASFSISWWLCNRSYAFHPTHSYVWLGALTDSSVAVRTFGGEGREFAVTERDSGQLVYHHSTMTHHNGSFSSFTVTGLNATTRYDYRYGDLWGSFSTTSPPGVRWNFTVATSGCAFTGSRHHVFDRHIVSLHRPVLFVHLGDFHYEDIRSDSLEEHHQAIRRVLNSPSQALLYRHTALVYMWDDHDWLGNDSGYENSTAREVALESYQFFPSYPLQQKVPYHAFTIGTVRFVISDLRSEATKDHIMSDAQKQWLRKEFLQAPSYDFVIWATTKPWMGELDDSWQGHAEDRREISEFLSNHTRNVLAIASDAHLLAFDDGSHTYFGNRTGNDRPPSFPLLQAGPLDRHGSSKAGMFTEGCFATLLERNHQYAIIRYEFVDEPCLIVSGYNQAEKLFEKRLCGDDIYQFPGTSQGHCDIQLLSSRTVTVWGVCVGLLLLNCGVSWLGWHSLRLVTLVVGSLLVTLAVGIAVPFLRGIPQVHTYEIALVLLVQSIVTSLVLLSLLVLPRTIVRRRESTSSDDTTE